MVSEQIHDGRGEKLQENPEKAQHVIESMEGGGFWGGGERKKD